MALLKMYSGPCGFDLMLLTGAASGYSVAWIMTTLDSLNMSIPGLGETPTDETGFKIGDTSPDHLGPNGETLYYTGNGRWGTENPRATFWEKIGTGNEIPGSEAFGTLMKMCTTMPGSFATLCVALLFTRAIFGTGGMSEMLKGIGEIVPL